MLKDVWTDKVNNVDAVLAEDVNAIAHELIQTQANTYTKNDVDAMITDAMEAEY